MQLDCFLIKKNCVQLLLSVLSLTFHQSYKYFDIPPR